MKKIIEFFKNRVVISVIGLIVLSLLIWFVGPLIKFGESNSAPLGGEVARLVTIIIIAVIWGLNNLRIQYKEKKSNADLVNDLQDDPDGGPNIVSGQSSEEMHQIGERFSNALVTLKKLKFKGSGSAKALYELPWYIIIGPPGSGKTTALINSSLDFPLAEQFGKGALQGVGGTRNCDWWFTNEAVLIDTAGRYTTQDSHKVVDSSAWNGFLKLLKKHRRRRPINGAIIAISLQDLLTQTEEERVKHAKVIRSRVDELMERLEIRFPIYLMFTKSDLVSGFTEFFEDLGKEDREQVWGVSLPNAPKPSQSPDLEYFDTEYKNLLTRLYERVLWRVHQERDVKRRAAIQGFPQQMENLKAIVDKFVHQTFIKNRYRFQPYLRGIYFSSGTQDGTPIDRLMSSVSANFGFSREMVAPSHQQGKSFFLGQLFRSVIFPESELVGSNRKYENLMRWTQRAAYVGMSAIVVIMLVIWTGSFTRNELYMHEVESYVAEFNAENKRPIRSSDIRTVLPRLNALAKASVVYSQEEHPWLSGFGMYDSNVDDAANKAYESQLRRIFLPRLIKYIEAYLKRGHRGGDLYSSFRTYVMFKKLDHMDKQQVHDWFSAKWDEKLDGEATKRRQLKAHLTALLNLEMVPAKLDKRLLASTRDLLLRVPVAQRIYERIRTNPRYTQRVNLFNEYGETVRETFMNSPHITKTLSMPLLFTKEGYESIDFSTDSSVISSIVNERWLLEDETKPSKVDFITDDLAEVSKKVKKLYLAEYATYWQRVYNVLDVKPFKNVRQANDVLTSFTDPVYSPLLSILQVGLTHTQLTNPAAANLVDDNKDGKTGKLTSFAAGKIDWNRVDTQFRPLNVLLRESSKRPAPVNAIILRISQLQEFVNEITLAPDGSKKAFEIAKVRYQSGAGNPISSLRAYAKTTPKPIKRWLVKLSEEAWRVILRSAHQHVSNEWRSRVYDPYISGLSGRYPLKRTSNDELALLDFVEFFKPGGTMDLFHQQYVKPFINTRHGWTNRGIDNYSLGLSQKTIKQIRKAQAIKSIFFRSNPEIPSMTFQLKPSFFWKKDVRFMLEVGSNRISYSHGPKFWKTLKWSAGDEQDRVRIIFTDLNEQEHSRTYEGPWAWFKLLGQSKLSKTSRSNVYLVTYGLGRSRPQGSELAHLKAPWEHKITYQIKAKSVNNPFKADLLGSFRISERI